MYPHQQHKVEKKSERNAQGNCENMIKLHNTTNGPPITRIDTTAHANKQYTKVIEKDGPVYSTLPQVDCLSYYVSPMCWERRLYSKGNKNSCCQKDYIYLYIYI